MISPDSAPTPIEPPFGQPSETDLTWYLTAFFIHKWTIAASVILVVVGTLFYSFWQKPLYSARVTVLIEPSFPRVLSNVAEVSDVASGEAAKTYYQTQYQILKGENLLSEVASRARLEENAEFLASIGITPTPNLPGAEPPKLDLVPVLKRRVEIEPVRDSQLVRVSVSDHDAERAALLANLMGEIYVEQNLTRRLEATRNATAWLDVQMKDLGTKLQDSEMALNQFMRDNNIVSVSMEDRKNITALELETITRALSETRVKRMEISAQMGEVAKARKDSVAVFSLSAVRNNPQVQALLAKQGERKVDLMKAAERYTPEHPSYRLIKAELAAVEQLIDQQLQQILDGLETDSRTVAQYEAELTANLTKVKHQAQELAQNEVEYNRLQRGYDTNKNLYTMVMTRLKETSLTGQLETNNVRLLERAKVPTRPTSPDIAFNIVMALIIGLGFGFGLAFLLTFFDDTIKGQEDVEKGLGLAYLGIVPSVTPANAQHQTLAARFQGWTHRQSVDIHRDLHVHNHPASAVAEYCRVIRSNLLFMSPDAPLRRIAVSSADPGAGKTATSLNLGILMSQTQGSTLLVDADMRCPKLHKAFGVPQDVGLSTLIAGGGRIEDAIKATEVPGLHVLPAGKTPPQPAELLHSKRFADIVDELQKRYSFIIFDTPPLMGLTDTMVLARHLEGVVLVARWRRTRRDLLRRVQQQLTDIGVKILGVVVNDVNLEDRAYYYYQYGRYQRYGNYSYAKSDT